MAHVLLSTKQVAAALGVDDRTVRNYVQRGQLGACRLSRRTLRYRPVAVAKFAGLDVAEVMASAFLEPANVKNQES